jgi:hypothetical protein
MTSKERLMLALHKEKPDRVPVTFHQWQQYHLDHFMGGMSALEAFKSMGMDPAIQYLGEMGQFYLPDSDQDAISTPEWKVEGKVVDPNPDAKMMHFTIHTPQGDLTYKTEADPTTTWIIEYLLKRHEDLDLIEKYMPVPKLDKPYVAKLYDEIGDDGILRGFVWLDQGGCWQQACCWMDVQQLIIEAIDNPDWLHHLLEVILERKLRFIDESLRGAKFDLIETGGGAGSDTVISPAMHREFCLPYDQRLHKALHDAGQMSSYHICGGMMHLIDMIAENGTDAHETLPPAAIGGNITDPNKVREVLGGKVCLVGGMNQHHILTLGTKEEIRAEVRNLFEGYGKDGGYIMSTADHFFDTNPENIRIYAEAARECVY